MADTLDIAKYLESRWHSKLALPIIFAFCITFYIFVMEAFGPYAAPFSVFIFFALLFAWYRSRRIEKTPEGKIGFCICIKSGNDPDEEKLKKDLIDSIYTNTSKGSQQSLYHISAIKSFHFEEAKTLKDVEPIRIKARAHFLLFGEVKKRMHRGKETYVLKVEANIAHATLPEDIQNQFNAVIGNSWITNINYPKDLEFDGLEMSGKLISINSKWLIANAALLSGDGVTAENIIRSVRSEISSSHHSIDQTKKYNENVAKPSRRNFKSKSHPLLQLMAERQR